MDHGSCKHRIHRRHSCRLRAFPSFGMTSSVIPHFLAPYSSWASRHPVLPRPSTSTRAISSRKSTPSFVRSVVFRSSCGTHGRMRIVRSFHPQKHGPEHQQCQKEKHKTAFVVEPASQEAWVNVNAEQCQRYNAYSILDD